MLHPGSGASGGVTGVAFSPDGNLLAAAYGDGTIARWDPVTEASAGSPLQAGSGVRGVAFSPDGEFLASADADGGVTLWTVATGRFYGPVLRSCSASSGGVTGVAFSANSTVLAAAYGDGTIGLWDPAASAAIGSPLQAGSGVNGVAFGPGGTLASAGANGAVKVWNTAGAAARPAGARLDHPGRRGARPGPGGRGGDDHHARGLASQLWEDVVDILLAVATLVVAAAVLYVTLTLSQRIRRTTAPLIDDLAGQLEATSTELRRQLQAVVSELRQDREQLRLDGRKIQGRLDHADSRLTTVANQLQSELDAIRRLSEQLGTQRRLGSTFVPWSPPGSSRPTCSIPRRGSSRPRRASRTPDSP